ncbi:UDP-N-acetylhexosamine pyrophosphorylase-like protein 1 [Copidosoma floridanum]|uniref:UDP-N-acetylhexosamine pyrophosphorylase-like protein 1 n=1 Tax=Copidosoma floridanum TaxID=29053 RepID=UPI0006C9AE58|nr:UDP-N-acetylhexosamine pyrophosphorylase-like protein 1 [Copidosoma floridanum]
MEQMSFKKLKSLLEEHGQQHLLNFWSEISEDEKKVLVKDIANLNLSQVIACFEEAMSIHQNKEKLPDDKIKPVPPNVMESISNLTSDKISFYENLGLREIANGNVAVIILAGGQGTRLGVNYPKGMYNINLPSNRSLFHIQVLRIRRLHDMAREKFGECKDLTLYIMTSDATHESTLRYFEKNDHFGIDKSKIVIFKQNTFPCFTFDGKIILDEKYKISRAPDGNGGLYEALKDKGMLKDMDERGIQSIHVFSVDNVLVKVADPVFLGYCIARSADCGVKVVDKRSSNEAVGVVCQVDGLFKVVEYSEISNATAELEDENGLVFNAGNICNHYFTATFLNEISEKHNNKVDLHIAKKKIPFVNENGTKCQPSVANGVKIEKFVFDVFKYSQNFVVWKVLRENEFSPLKNSDLDEIDCPLTAKRDILNLHEKWLVDAGATNVDGDVEICPLLSYSGENLAHIAKDNCFKGPLCLM